MTAERYKGAHVYRRTPIRYRTVQGRWRFYNSHKRLASVRHRVGERAPVADARRGVAAKSAALRTLHRRVKDLWKFLGCGAGGGGHTNVDGRPLASRPRWKCFLSLSHSVAFPCIRNTVLRIRSAVLTQFSDTIQRRGAIWTGHRSRNAVNRGDVKIVLQRLIAPLDRSECGLTSSRKYNSCRRTRRGRN